MRNGPYTAVIYSLFIHGLILLAIVLSAATKKKAPPQIDKQPAIKSFLYYPPKVEKVTIVKKQEPPLPQKTPNTSPAIKVENLPPSKQPADDVLTSTEKETVKSTAAISSIINHLKRPTIPTPSPKPLPTPRKLDSFTQLQRLRSKLNRSTITPSDNPYQSYQPPSAFNTNVKAVPHSMPVKDQEKQREKNTKNIGAGIAITKNDDGTCSVTQDMSAYGLSEGSSTQYFNCGESKFDKSFREHMEKVQEKLGK